MHGVEVQLVIGEHRTELGMNGVALDEEQLLFIAGRQDNAIDEDVDEQPVQDLALNVDNVFQADDCDAFDSDVDEAPTAQTMFMANLSSADPVYDEACLSYDSDILSETMIPYRAGKDNVINKLKTQISHWQETRSEVDRTLDFRALDFQITQLTEKVTVLQEQNELFRAENAKIKQHYKELYDSIKITRVKHLEQTNALTTENENLKAQMQTKMKSVTKDHVKPTVLPPGKYAIDVEPISPRNRNNREVHLDYLRHLKENVETLREIVEEAKVERPLDRSIVFACRYTKHSQELLEYAIGACPKDFNKRDKKHAPTPLISKKQVTFKEQCDTSNSNTHIHVGQLNTQQTNVPVPPST
ncbi:hypothetical protein Tco_0057769 [Tanacetum coccineum]